MAQRRGAFGRSESRDPRSTSSSVFFVEPVTEQLRGAICSNGGVEPKSRTLMFKLKGAGASRCYPTAGGNSQMKRITNSPTLAMRRLVEALDARGFRVELKKKDKGRAIVLRRDGVRRVVEFQPHNSRTNLWLLFQVAAAGKNVRGAGMTWREIREVTRWAPILPFEEVHAKRIRAKQKEVAA